MNDIDEASSGGPILTEHEREFAHNALQEFKKGNYIACLQQLNKLETRNNDYKVMHNKAVAEYFKSDLKKTDQFKKALTSVFTQARMRPEVIDDVEQCVAQYNLAVLLYHQQQYSAALRIVNRLLSFVEPMDDSLAHRVCLLLIELHITTFQPEKALNLINYIENQIINSEVPFLLSVDREIKILKKETKEKKKMDSATELFQKKLLQYQARCNLIVHDLKTAKNDIHNDNNGTPMLCLKANFEYLRGNHKNALQILQSMPVGELEYKQCGESSTVLFYNNVGIIHHALGKHHLAAHYLQQAIKENDNCINSLPKFDTNEPLSGRPLHTLGGTRKHELMLNLGIALLYAGRSAHAFDCFVMAVQRYHRNPRIWIRLAECCIQVHKSSNETDFDSKKQSSIVSEQIGSGKHQKVILASNLSKDKKYSAESQSYAVPMPTLEFGMLCLRNAILLLPTESPPPPVSPPTTLTGPAGAPPPSGPSVAPSALASQQQINALRNSVLAAAAYISLCLGDYVMTLEYSKKLLEQPDLSSVHRLLSHLYSAESLVLINKVPEAIEHLDPELFQNLSFDDVGKSTAGKDSSSNNEFSINTKPPTKWFPNNTETIQNLLKYNLAVALVYRGDYDKASEILKQVWMAKSSICQIPIHVVMLVLYVELQLGHVEVTKTLIKQHCKSL